MGKNFERTTVRITPDEIAQDWGFVCKKHNLQRKNSTADILSWLKTQLTDDNVEQFIVTVVLRKGA